MYISASLIKKVRVGEPLIIQEDELFGEVIMKSFDGNTVGIAMDCNVEGCITKSFLKSKITGKKLLGEATLISGNICIIDCESSVLNYTNEKLRNELENYRRCCA